MSEQLARYRSGDAVTVVSLPHDAAEVAADWAALRSRMIVDMPPQFTRDEWAYLIAFLEARQLEAPFRDAWGEREDASSGPVRRFVQPRDRIAVWLPNNVSLLGPLTLALLSLPGPAMRFKAGSKSENLTRLFIEYARDRLRDGPLRRWLVDRVSCEEFGRGDERHRAMAAEADVRLVFGSDEAARTIDALPHPADSIGLSFADRRSEAWLEAGAIDDRAVDALTKVFAIYGRTGCTSPRRAVVIDGEESDAWRHRDAVVERWDRAFRKAPPPDIASQNVMARQVAAAFGWDARLTRRAGAVLAVGSGDLPEPVGDMTLTIGASTLERAIARLPDNVQTIGHCLADPTDSRWLRALARRPVLRFVPIGRMHHFGPVWDGWSFWRLAFREVEVSA